MTSKWSFSEVSTWDIFSRRFPQKGQNTLISLSAWTNCVEDVGGYFIMRKVLVLVV
jgi:hypothetical protein